MKKKLLTFIVLLSMIANAQVLITDTTEDEPNANAILEIRSANKGMIVPRLTTQAMTNLKDSGKAVEGLIVFDSNRKCYFGYQNSDWVDLGGNCAPPPVEEFFEGDFAFTALRADNPDRFSMITMVTIPVGEVFYITDSGWKSDNTFRSTEGNMQWTVTETIPARTEITFESPQSINNAFQWTTTHGTLALANDDQSVGIGPSLTTDGDNIIIYTATDSNAPYTSVDTMIAALKLEGPWNTNSTSTSTSTIPTGLVEDITALALEADGNNQSVNCSAITSGMTDAQLRSVLNDDANWSSFPSSSNPIPTGCLY